MIKSLAICGPTASGKTALSLLLAEKIPLEIISLDSMQIYKGMDIGTAKATKGEMAKVTHHMIDVVSPLENYIVGMYREAALSLALEIASRGKLPLFVGGTGLYYDSLIRNPDKCVPKSDKAYTEKMLADTDSEEKRIALWQKLFEIDRESAENIHYNNLRRVIRALEIYRLTGRKKSELDRESRLAAPPISVELISLDFHNRENLYNRIDCRVDVMMNEGLFGEVKALYENGLLKEGSTALSGIGYKEIISHLKGEITLDEAVSKIKLSSRRYAKRQLTWFRHVENRHTVFLDTESGNMKQISDVFAEILGIINRLELGD